MRCILFKAYRSTARAAPACSYGAGSLLLAALLAVLPLDAAAQSPVSITADQGSSELVEGQTATFTVERRGDVSEELTVNYQTLDGSGSGILGRVEAEHGDDYTDTTGTLVFPAGNSQSQQISVPTSTDDVYEPREYFRVEVWGSYSAGGRTISFREFADRRILEAEERQLSLSPVTTVTTPSDSYPEFAAAEGGQNILTISLDEAVPYPHVIEYDAGTTAHRTATEDDYTMVMDGKVVIPPGQLSASITLDITDDMLVEPVERFTMRLFSVGNSEVSGNPRRRQLFKNVGFEGSESSNILAVSVAITDNDMGQSVYLHGQGSWNSGAFSSAAQFPTTRSTLTEGQSTVITAEITGDAPSTDITIPLKVTGYPAGEVTTTDYSLPSSVTIKSGQTSADVTLTITDDDDDERQRELLLVEVGDPLPTGYVKGNGTRKGFEVIMVDNDSTGATLLPLSTASLYEDSTRAQEATFNIEMDRLPKQDAPAGAPFTGVDVREPDPRFNLRYSGRATHNTDYTSPTSVGGGGCATANDKLTCTATVTVKDDDLYEGGSGTTENVMIDLQGSGFPNGYNVSGSPTLSLTIEDDDLQPMFSITDASVTEGGTAKFKITRSSGAKENRISVRAKTADGGTNPATSDENKDYTAKTQTLTLGKNANEATLEVETTQDVIDELAETFLVELDQPRDRDNLPAPAIADDEATGTINDDDDPPTALTITVDTDAATDGDQATIGEGAAATTVTVTARITNPTRFATAQTVTIAVGKDDETAVEGTDYAEVDDFNVIIPAEQASGSATFELDPTDNDVDAENKTLSVEGALTGMTVTHAAITIEDDDERGITVSAATDGVTVDEVDSAATMDAREDQATYTVVLNSEPTGTVTVNLESDDTDVATVAPSSLAFDADNWETAQTVTVTAEDDSIDNTGDERATTITHTVSAEDTDYERETAGAVSVTVTDDDAAPTALTITVDTDSTADGDQATISEGADKPTVQVTATLDGATTFATAKTVSVTVGSADDSATEGTGGDYDTVADISITLPVGAKSASGNFTLTLNDDAVDEPDETISVAGTLTDVTVTGTTITIEDDDATPTVTLTLTPATINESGTTNASTVMATMDGLSSEPVTLTVSATPVTPAVAADFTLSDDTTLTIPALSQTSTGAVTLTAVDNDVDAVDRTVTVSATASGGHRVTAPASRTLTITDDDTRGITVTKTALTLSEEDDTTSTSVSEHQDTYDVVLTSEPAGGTVTITVTSGDTTIAGVSPASLAFGATDWNTPKTVTVTAVADTADNPMDRRIATITHTVSAAGSDYADETARRVTVTVNDDDGAPTLSINNPTVTEGDSATAALSFTVRLTPASGRQVTVAYGDRGTGTARAGTDYTALAAGTLTFAPGDTSKTVAVTVTGDVIDEPDETVVVRLSSPANATLTGGETTLDGTGTIEDNDPTPTVSVADAAAVTEGDVVTPDPPNNMTFTVQLSAASGRLVTVPYILGGIATAGADYTAPDPLSVTIAPGSTEADITIPVKGDHVDEGNETVTVTLGTPTHATVSTAEDAGTATGTLTDDDTRGITVSAAADGVSVAEADNTATTNATENQATYTVVLDSQPTGTVTVNLESEDTDIATVAPVSLTFTTGNWNTAQTVTVTGVADIIDNPNDRRTVDIAHTVSATGTDYASETADPVTVTVTDDDAAPGGVTLTVDTNGATAGTPDTVAEGAGATAVTVNATVNGGTRYGEAKTVTVSVGDGTAASPADYAAVADFTIAIPAGGDGHSETFTITPADDALDEPDETVNVTGAAGSITVTPDVLTLTDNDVPPSFSIAAAEADEGEAVVFTVSRAGATANVATVKVATAADTDEDAEAAAASDYTAISPAQTLSFAAGDTSKTVSVATVEDDLFEPDETFLAVLSMPALGTGDPGTGVGIAADGGRARGTIKDDDVQPSFSIADASATEGTAITFTVTRSGARDNAVSVKWNTKADTGAGAAAATDYTASTTPAQLDFAGGVTTVTFTVATTDDLLDEDNETFLVELTDAEGATITTAEATGTVTDDDAAPSAITLTVDADTGADNVQDSIAEDGGAKMARITATITSATRFAAAQDVTVTVGKTGDSAVAGTDYDEVADLTITLPVGAASAHVDVRLTPKQDTLAEGDETISIEGELSGVTVTPTSLTLTDDESTPTATLVLTPASIDESGGDNESTVTATLSGASSQAVTLTVAATPVNPAVAADYALSGTTLTIAAGRTASTGAVTVTAVDNDVDAPDKTVTVSATATGGNGVADPANRTLTIEDDDTRGITVSAAVAGVRVAEADNTATTNATENEATYTVVLDSQPTGTVSVNLESEDTDIATVAPARLTFTTGNWNTAQTVTVTGVADIIDNPNDRRTVDIAHTVSATGTDYASETADPVTVTVTDDDAAPGGVTLTVDTNGAADGTPDTVAEGAGATAVTVTATVNGSTRYGEAKTVTVSVDDGTAASPADYAAVADFTIAIPAGGDGHSETFTITPADDALDEPDETVNVTGAAGSITVTPDVLTLTDNDAPPSFSIAAAEADEGEAVVFTVSRAGATANVATVKVATAADTDEDAEAASAGDYTAINPAQTLSFAAGDTSKTVSVATVEDDLFEPDETFLAVLSMPALGVGDPGTGVGIAAAGGSARGTIKDDDVQPAFSIADASATEGTAITFTVTRGGAEDNAVSVKWNTKADTGAGAAAATDYTASTTPAQLDFAGGVTTVTFTVATTDDLLDEGNETFLVELTDAEGATITTAEATGTITDDDAAPSAITLTVDADTAADEVQDSLAEDGGAKTARVTATITSATRFAAAQDVTVTVGKAADSATEGTDYDEVAALTITLPAGAASAHVDARLTPKQDTLAEGDETISIEGELTGVTVTPTSLTLTDDEATPTATLALTPASIDESGAGNRSTVTATLSGASSQPVTLTVAAAPVAPAVAGDYTLSDDTTLTIPALSQTSTGTVTLTAVDNAVDAVDRTVTVSATATGGNGVANPASRTLTIEDDDERGITVSAAADGVSVAEADDPATMEDMENEATYTVVLDSQPTGTVTVNLESEDTDVATVAPARLAFTAGNWSTARTVTVTGVADIIDNANDRRTVDIAHTVSASGTDYASETAGAVTVTVADDDAAPGGVTLTVDTNGAAAGTPDTVAEGAGATVVTVTATVDGATRYAGARTVTVSVGDGTAVAPADYAAVADFTITIPAGMAGHSGAFTMTPVDDALDEPDETVTVTGASGSITIARDVLTLTDNDAPPSFSIAAAEADEGEAVVFTVSRAGATANVATVKVATAADTDEDAEAASAGDYTAINPAQTLSFAAGDTSKTVSVATVEDDLFEPDETFLAVLSMPALGVGDPGTGVALPRPAAAPGAPSRTTTCSPRSALPMPAPRRGRPSPSR